MSTLRIHHVAVQTSDLSNSVAWYRDFFGCTLTWSADTFSELTRQRLPGVTRLTELQVGEVRFHMIERTVGGPGTGAVSIERFQHVCFQVPAVAELETWRQHWNVLFASGRYSFVSARLPTEVIPDGDGSHSFYCVDVHGLEFEFMHQSRLVDDQRH